MFITVDAAHFAAHGDISGFGELFAELHREMLTVAVSALADDGD